MNEITSLSPSVMRQIKLPYATPTCSHRRWLHRGNRELRRLCLQHVCYFMLDVRTSVGRDIRVGIIRDDLGFGLGSGLWVTVIRLLFGVRIRGPIYKISYDLSQDYREFIVTSAYDSDLQRAKSSRGISVTLSQTILRFCKWIVSEKSLASFVRCLVNETSIVSRS